MVGRIENSKDDDFLEGICVISKNTGCNDLFLDGVKVFSTDDELGKRDVLAIADRMSVLLKLPVHVFIEQ